MSISTRIRRTLAIVTIAVSGTVVAAPAVSAAVHGPDDMTIPTPCTHGCDGGGGGGFDGPDDFKAPEPGPVVDPAPADQPVVIAQPTFTG